MAEGRGIAPEASDEALVAAAQHGDDAALQTVLTRYRPFARSKTRSYFLPGAESDDVVQEGMIGLFKAVRDFDPTVGPFAPFADLCIRRQIGSALRATRRQKHTALNGALSLDEPLCADDGVRPDPVCPEPGPLQLLIASEQLEGLRQGLSQELTAIEREVLVLYLNGSSYSEMCRELKRHRKAIDNALQRVKRKARRHIDAIRE